MGWGEEDLGPFTDTDYLEEAGYHNFGWGYCGGGGCGNYNLFVTAEDATY